MKALKRVSGVKNLKHPLQFSCVPSLLLFSSIELLVIESKIERKSDKKSFKIPRWKLAIVVPTCIHSALFD